MRPMVARLSAIENPTPEQSQILTELGDDLAEPGMYYVIDDNTQAIIWPAFLFLRANYGSNGLVTEDNPVPSFATNKKDAYNLREWLIFVNAVKARLAERPITSCSWPTRDTRSAGLVSTAGRSGIRTPSASSWER